MTYSIGVAIVDGLNDLSEDISALFFFEIFLVDNSVKELSTTTNFQKKINILFVFKEIIKSENIWMIL